MLTESWSSAQYLKHLSSWSGTRYHREASKVDLMLETEEELNALWGDEILTVQWPLTLNVFLKNEKTNHPSQK